MKPTWTKHYCVDCKKQLSYQGERNKLKRCGSCAAQYRIKVKPYSLPKGFKKGKENFNYTGNMHRDSAHICTPRYNRWRKKVYSRDNFTCQLCGYKGKGLQAHHIKPWVSFIKHRYLVKNGLTCCIKCHGKIHGRSNK